jgi:ascorbate-specific PTS system EIIC-type component UlaA
MQRALGYFADALDDRSLELLCVAGSNACLPGYAGSLANEVVSMKVSMKNARGAALATLMALVATPVFAFNLNEAANAVSNATGGQQKATAAPEAAGLLNTLGTQLNVTPQQAVGGTGALLGLAKNKLSGNDYSSLSKSVPGLDQLSGSSALGSLGGLGGMLGGSSGSSNSAVSSALGNVQSMGDVNSAFSALGMDSGMVGQFVPVILQYLGQQGASGSALSALSGVWGAK